MKNIFDLAKPYLLALVIFVVVSTLYFLPQLDGKVVRQGDIEQYKGMAQESLEFRKQTGEMTLWTNSMFGGMPTYQITATQPGNLMTYVSKLYSLFLTRPIGYFFSLMLGFYIMLLCFGVKNWLAVVGAVAFAFSTNNFVLFDAGHVTKLRTISTIPLIIGGLQLFVRKKYKLGFALFLLGFALNILSNHYQMTYYFLLTALIWVIVQAVKWIKAKDYAAMTKTSLLAIGGVVLALGCSAALLINTYQYSKDTMRGDPILKKEVVATDSKDEMSSSTTKGLSWPYAMQWSNSLKDVGSAIIPGFVGGSSNEIVRKESEMHDLFKRMEQPVRRKDGHYQGPLYWGALPFTSGPVYFGAIVMFLFVLGLINVKSSVRTWVIISVILTVLLSLGKNLEFFQRIFFNYFPMYNKFRTPSSILSITAIFIPLLGMLGLHNLITNLKEKKSWDNVKLAAIITGGFCALMALIGPMFFDFIGPGDYDQSGKLQYNQDVLDVFIGERKYLFRMGAARSAALIALSAGLLWALINNKLKQIYVIAGLGLLITIDLWGIGKRYLGEASFIPAAQMKRSFQPRQADLDILSLESNRGAYRVLDLSANPWSSSYTSYFHNSLGGYHAAKLQRYQDIIDNHFNGSLNLGVLNMLNAKYIISQKGEMQVNRQAFGNAWFVKSVQPVSSPREEIDSVGTADLANTAIVNTADFPEFDVSKTYSGEGTIEMTSYSPNKLVYESNSSSEQLAVFSEIWFGPNKGWNIKIDNEEIPNANLRANYVLRALKVPAGKHTITMTFAPESFKTNNMISLASSSAVILLCLFFFLSALRDKLMASKSKSSENKVAKKA